MINILLPMAGVSDYFDNKLYPYPVPLIEVGGKPMIERVINNLKEIGSDNRFIFIVRSEDCRRFHLDSTLSLLVPSECELVRLQGETKGALCSALMAIEFVNNDMPLIICNSDQLFDNVLEAAVMELIDSDCDAGCITFESVHPRWSYVKIVNDAVVEATEKKPVSRNAIAGFYYFKTGRQFVKAAMDAIYNDVSVDGKYYIAPVFNQLILNGCKIKAINIPDSKYHSFYTPQRIDEYSCH